MRATNWVRLLPAVVLMLTSVGCENQQAMLDAVKGEKAEIEKRLTEVTEKVNQLMAESETLKSGVAQVEEAAAQAKVSAEEALASAKQEASEALSKAIAEAEAKMANAAAEAKNALDAASAKVAELEAALKKAQQPTPEETPAEE